MGRDGEESILGRGNSLNKGMAAIIDTAAHIPDGRLLLGGKGAGGKQGLDGEETVVGCKGPLSPACKGSKSSLGVEGNPYESLQT